MADMEYTSRRGGPGFWKALPFEQKVEFARNFARNRRETFTGLERNPVHEAARAKSLLEASQQGEIELPAQEQDRLRQAVRTEGDLQKKRELKARAEQLGAVGAVAQQAAAAGSLGIGPAIRNAISPKLAGLESEIAEERPFSSMAGQFVGAAPTVLAGAAGGAALAGRLTARPIAGAVARAAGRFLGGEASQFPVAVGQALGQGADLSQSGEAGLQAITQTPVAVQKLATGQELSIDDRLNLAFLVLEGAGLPSDFARAAPAVKSLAQATAFKIAQSVTNPEVGSAQIREMVQQALEAPQARLAIDPAGAAGEPRGASSREAMVERAIQPEVERLVQQVESQDPISGEKTSAEEGEKNRVFSASEVMAHIAGMEKSADAVKAMVGEGNYELSRVPVETFTPQVASVPDFKSRLISAASANDTAAIRAVLKEARDAGEISLAKLKKIGAQRSKGAAPSIVAVGDELSIADGTHRWIDAVLTGQKDIEAYVPVARDTAARQQRDTAARQQRDKGMEQAGSMTVRALRAEAKRLGIAQHDNERGQPSLRRRVEEARRLEAEAPQREDAAPVAQGGEEVSPEPGSAPMETGVPVTEKNPPEPPSQTAPGAEEDGGPRAIGVSGTNSATETGPVNLDAYEKEASLIFRGGETAHARLGKVSDEALMKASQMAEPDSVVGRQIAAQLKIRGIQDVSDAAIQRHAWNRILREGDRERLPDLLQKMPKEVLGHFLGVKKAGPVAKALQKEAASRRQGGGEAVMGFPASAAPTASGKRLSQVRARLAARQHGKVQESAHAIIRDLHRALGMSAPGIGGSRSLKKKALGFYRPTAEAIRMRMADDINTMTHEVGHHLHKLLFHGGVTPTRRQGGVIAKTVLSERVFPAHWGAELEQAGKALYGKNASPPPGGFKSEGFAELIRLMMTDPPEAAKRFPTVHPEVLHSVRSDYPQLAKLIDSTARRYQLYESQSPFQKGMSYIRSSPPPKGPIAERLRNAWDYMAQMFTDRNQPLVRMVRDLGLEGKRMGTGDPLIAAYRNEGWAAADFDLAMTRGTFDPVSRALDGGKPLSEILDPIKEHFQEYEGYVSLLRAREKRAQGREGVFAGMENSEIQAAIADAEARFPEFKEAETSRQAFDKWFFEDYLVANGLLTHEKARSIRSMNLHYLTFKKIKVAEQPGPGQTIRPAGKYSAATSGVRRFADFKGEQIEPPIAAWLANLNAMMRYAAHNNVGQRIVGLFSQDPSNPSVKGGVEGIGKWIDKIDRPVEAMRVKGTDIGEAVRKRIEETFAGEAIDEDTLDILTHLLGEEDYTFFKPGLKVDRGSRRFAVMIDGKPTFWEAKDPGLFEFVAGVGNPALMTSAFWSPIVRLMRAPKETIRAGATTYNPTFVLTNPIRDFVLAMATSQVKGFYGTKAKAWIKAFFPNGIDDAFLSSGARHSSVFKENVGQGGKVEAEKLLFGRRHVIGKMMEQGEYLKAFYEIQKLPWAGISKLNERAEIAWRLAEYHAKIAEAKKRGRPIDRAAIEEAGQAAADVTIDYHRGGRFSMGANQFIPFFNASVIGGEKLIRYFRRNPWEATGRMAAWIIGPTVTAFMLNKDDPEYFDIPIEERDRYWHIPIGDPDHTGKKKWIRIPRPYGLGALAAATDRIMNSEWGIDPITGKRGDPQAFRGLGGTVFREFRPPYTVPVIGPLIETAINHSIFYGGPIVREGERFGPKSEQGAERSSDFAFGLGRLMDIEPPKIDYMVQNVFGTLGKDINRYALSPLVRVAREDLLGWEEKPRKKIVDPLAQEQWYIVNRFLTSEPVYRTETMERFYSRWDELSGVYQGLTRRKYRPEEHRTYASEHAAELRAYHSMRPYKSQMESLYGRIKANWAQGNLSDDEIYREQESLFRDLNESAREGYIRSTRPEPAESGDEE